MLEGDTGHCGILKDPATSSKWGCTTLLLQQFASIRSPRRGAHQRSESVLCLVCFFIEANFWQLRLVRRSAGRDSTAAGRAATGYQLLPVLQDRRLNVTDDDV